MKYIVYGVELVIATIIMYVLKPFLPKNIWMVSERADQAQDNGIAFFKYLCREQKNVFPVYLLEKNSNKIEEVSKIGTVIQKGSLKHKVYFLNAKVVATTEKNIIEPWGAKLFYSKFSWLYPKKLKVFLQHGIVDKDVSAVYGKAVSNFDMFIASTQAEKQFIIDKFGYEDEEVKVTGLARYDYLWQQKDIVKKENIILYAPTWRRYLIDLANQDKQYIEDCKKAFIQSEYFKSIQEVLSSQKLQSILEKHDFKLVLITHHAMNHFADLFVSNSPRVEIFKSEDVTIADWLLKSKVFITDYSSIHFDSGYIGNGNIYYQFDQEAFKKQHAGVSYFTYEKNGFGRAVSEVEALLKAVEQEVMQKDNHEAMYTHRRKAFFAYFDSLNCQRIYMEIKNRLNEENGK